MKYTPGQVVWAKDEGEYMLVKRVLSDGLLELFSPRWGGLEDYPAGAVRPLNKKERGGK